MTRAPHPRRSILFATIITALLAFPAGVVLAAHQFGDVPNSNPFHGDIDALVNAGVTAGCGGGNYCPKSTVTREQMAAVLNRLGALSSDKTPVVNADRLDGLDSSEFIQGKNGRLAYAWANSPTSPSYTADPLYSYNSGGGAITINRTGTGVYSVSFAGLHEAGGNVQVTKYGSGAGVCHVASWGASKVGVRCYDMAGNALDANYTVLVTD